MQVSETQLRLFSSVTRPIIGGRIPVVAPLCKWLLKRPALQNLSSKRPVLCEYLGGKMQVDLRSAIEFDVLFRGGHEMSHLRLFHEILQPGDVCVDVGANVGVHTLVMAKLVGSNGRVFALEPHPKVHRKLTRNVALNGYTQVTTIEKALCSENAEVTLFSFAQSARNQGVSSLTPNERTSGESIPVAGITGACLESEYALQECKLIKIDVEGMEPVVLNQLWPLIMRCSPYVLFEYREARWPKNATSLEVWRDRFAARGYELFVSKREILIPLSETSIPKSCEIFCAPRVV